jgi:hypothetical protein
MVAKNDGGPAFPQLAVEACERDGHGDPVEPFTSARGGMTLRDWFAGQALAGFLADGSQRLVARAIEEGPNRHLIQDPSARAAIVNEQIALGVYALADAMLRERDRERGE